MSGRYHKSYCPNNSHKNYLQQTNLPDWLTPAAHCHPVLLLPCFTPIISSHLLLLPCFTPIFLIQFAPAVIYYALWGWVVKGDLFSKIMMAYFSMLPVILVYYLLMHVYMFI